jgi:hypothetical protein
MTMTYDNFVAPGRPGFCDAGQLIIDTANPCPRCGAGPDMLCRGHWQYDNDGNPCENTDGKEITK